MSPIFPRFALLFLYLVSVCGTARATESCATPVAQSGITADGLKQDEWVDDRVELVWFPKAGYGLVSHAELAVDGELWNGNVFYHKDHSLEAAERNARAGRKAFVRFGLRVTARELEDLKAFLAEREGKLSYRDCVGGACRALGATTKIRVPFPISQVPTLAALYLGMAKTFGYSRITKVEYTGNNIFKTFFGLEVVSELYYSAWAASSVGALAVTWLNQMGHVFQTMVGLQ